MNEIMLFDIEMESYGVYIWVEVSIWFSTTRWVVTAGGPVRPGGHK